MAIAKKPTLLKSKEQKESKFIAAAATQHTNDKEVADKDTHPVLIRVERSLLNRIDKAAGSLALNRTSFILTTLVERVKRIENEG